MSYETCSDCGCKVYGGHCINCHEEIFIAKQYYELNEAVPQSISDKAIEQEANPTQTEKEYFN